MQHWIPFTFLTLAVSTLPFQGSNSGGDASDAGVQEGLVRVGANDEQLDLANWRGQLAQPDFAARQTNFEALIARAKRSSDVLSQLREWSHGDDEFAWTCHLALREAQRDDNGLGLRPMRQDNDPFGDRFRLRLEDAWSPVPQDFLRDIEQQLNDAFGSWNGLRQQAPGQGLLHSERQSYKYESTPDGVRIEVDEEKNGETETKVYEGRTLEEILAANPELKGTIGDQGWIGLDHWQDLNPFDGLRDWGLWNRLRGNNRLDRDQTSPWSNRSGPRTDLLGVRVREQSTGLGGNAKGQREGLLIDSILPGTIASELGIRPGEVLVELNGQPIHETSDVRAVLHARSAADEIRAKLMDANGEERVLSWVPPAGRVF